MTTTIDGKTYEYDEITTEFRVEIGRYAKGAYKRRNTFAGKAVKMAVMYYNGINIGNGYKKRLLLIRNGARTIIAKAAS